MKVIIPFQENCTGCRYCEEICTLWHEEKVVPEKSRIVVFKNGVKDDIPFVCCQNQNNACEGHFCLDVCPYEAIYKKDGIVLIENEKCTACGLCQDACQYNAIRVVDELARKCDLCNGSPQCVKYCPMKAITYEEYREENFQKNKKFLEKIKTV